MIWQDYIITGAGFLFSYGVFIQVISNFKRKKCDVNKQTSASMFIGLGAIAISLLTLNLYLSFALNTLLSIIWLIILIQSYLYS